MVTTFVDYAGQNILPRGCIRFWNRKALGEGGEWSKGIDTEAILNALDLQSDIVITALESQLIFILPGGKYFDYNLSELTIVSYRQVSIPITEQCRSL